MGCGRQCKGGGGAACRRLRPCRVDDRAKCPNRAVAAGRNRLRRDGAVRDGATDGSAPGGRSRRGRDFLIREPLKGRGRYLSTTRQGWPLLRVAAQKLSASPLFANPPARRRVSLQLLTK